MDEETLREARKIIWSEQAANRQRYAEIFEENRRLKAAKADADRLAELIVGHEPAIIGHSRHEVTLYFHGESTAAEFVGVLEDLFDAALARKAKAAVVAGGPTVPWDDLKAELGLTHEAYKELREGWSEDLPVDCSDIPEITELGPRLERDAEGRLIPGMRSTSG